MPVRTTDRRRNPRIPAAYPVRLFSTGGRDLGRARSVNISAGGIGIMTADRAELPRRGELVVEVSIPDAARASRPNATRTVRYRGRIVRDQQLGQMVGLGIQFLRKLA
jgi:c-di-GMP-binding flagellar brake protein YcgR